ncbi:MAG TPA: sigma-70 family RNA polymerase sigma factor [Blastocatellia bacterium]|jgi:RNA polymerase sigma factor (TIGR02999 family)|nr:sigma-70 family RNA polymerase sigma factor [Blastocatellia bacterium]
MHTPSPNEITERLIAWGAGDRAALDHLLPIVYQELRRMAGHYLRQESPGHTLQPTALVHEAWLRLIDQTRVNWRNRAQFFGVAAQMMRRILVDHAKTKHREKRGGDAVKLSLDEMINLSRERAADLIALDDALDALTRIDERKSRVVELRYFGGFSVEESAQILEVSPETVMRDWKIAKAWLYQQIRREAGK